MTHGQAVSLKWVLGIVTAMLGAGIMLYINDTADRTKGNEARIRDVELRIGANEADIAAIRAEMTYLRGSMLRIETKLDDALAKRR